MKFIRHLSVVMVVVAVIVGLGMLWAHASGGTDAGNEPQRLEQIRAGMISVRPDNGFHLAETGNLIRTCEIEAALAAVVVTVSAARRRHRRTRRTAAGA